MFWRSHTVLFDIRNEVEDLVGEEGRNAEDAGNADCDEAKSSHAKIEVVDVTIYQREDFEDLI